MMDWEGETLIYFYAAENKNAKKHIWNIPKLHYMEAEMKECMLKCIEVPEFYMGGRPWNIEKLRELLKEEIDKPDIGGYYLEPLLSKLIHLESKLPPKQLLEQVLRQNSSWESLYLIGNDRGETEEDISLYMYLLGEYFPRINQLIIVTDKPQEYEAVSAFLYEEYGTPVAFFEHLESRQDKKQKTVIMDNCPGYRIPVSSIPHNAVYIDFYSEIEKQRQLSTRRRDVYYLSVVKFLDTITKNGYNTIVNRTNNYVN